MRHMYKGAEYWNVDESKKVESDWRKMLKSFKPKEIKFIQDKVYVSFSDDDYDTSIKKI